VTAVELLTVDVGNSSIGLGAWTGDVVQFQRVRDPEDALAWLRGGHAPILLVSVAPQRRERVLRGLPEARRAGLKEPGSPPSWLGPAGLLESAGRDRVAAVLAVAGGPAVVVDAGTAVTVEAVDAGGRWLGGFIAPGPTLAASALPLGTEQLKQLASLPAALVPGQGTETALRAGLWGLAVGGVDRLVQEARAAIGADSAPIIATGGWGAEWMRDSRHAGIRHDAALVHRGLRRWWLSPGAS